MYRYLSIHVSLLFLKIVTYIENAKNRRSVPYSPKCKMTLI